MVDISDKFGVETMSAAEYADKEKYVVSKCRCSECPTYVGGDKPIGYCYPPIGTSKVIKVEKECICKTCPIYQEYELDHTFYCTRCSQVCQAHKAESAVGP
jgi:hypothetical protein